MAEMTFQIVSLNCPKEEISPSFAKIEMLLTKCESKCIQPWWLGGRASAS